ncbi:hypothetical protein [Alternaria dianthicola dsRNA virus 1]|uniref:Uncharacterized protein n=1 Tax=Alternaria dianthicola dsRNA virus 1 TaxID=2813952 RepID=A0A895HMI1_9VIRU|nr:hypothetical protein [Alternaria dianthicola dsRNA virus 1]
MALQAATAESVTYEESDSQAERRREAASSGDEAFQSRTESPRRRPKVKRRPGAAGSVAAERAAGGGKAPVGAIGTGSGASATTPAHHRTLSGLQSPTAFSPQRAPSPNAPALGVKEDPDVWATQRLAIVQAWHRANGVEGQVPDVAALFPSPWKLGRTDLNYTSTSRGRWLRWMLPELQFFDGKNNQQETLRPGRGEGATKRVTAKWDAPVVLVSRILSFRANREVTKEEVASVAQQSPEALEKLKEAGKAYKAHVTRLLDMVALRRSPEYNAVAMRYKAELKVAIDEQMQAVIAMRRATRRVNEVLAARDKALAALDPAYEPKKKSAADALAKYGIDLGSEGDEMASLEDERGANVLDELDF